MSSAQALTTNSVGDGSSHCLTPAWRLAGGDGELSLKNGKETKTPNEALPQTDEVYAEDGALIAIANDRWTPIEPAGTMP